MIRYLISCILKLTFLARAPSLTWNEFSCPLARFSFRRWKEIFASGFVLPVQNKISTSHSKSLTVLIYVRAPAQQHTLHWFILTLQYFRLPSKILVLMNLLSTIFGPTIIILNSQKKGSICTSYNSGKKVSCSQHLLFIVCNIYSQY